MLVAIFDRIKSNLSEIQPKSHQNVQKTRFLQKVAGVNGLNPLRDDVLVNPRTQPSILLELFFSELPSFFVERSYKMRKSATSQQPPTSDSNPQVSSIENSEPERMLTAKVTRVVTFGISLL